MAAWALAALAQAVVLALVVLALVAAVAAVLAVLPVEEASYWEVPKPVGVVVQTAGQMDGSGPQSPRESPQRRRTWCLAIPQRAHPLHRMRSRRGCQIHPRTLPHRGAVVVWAWFKLLAPPGSRRKICGW